MLATATPIEESSVQSSNRATHVRVEYNNVEDFLVDYTSNETIGGMFIKTDCPLAVGTSFKLRIQLPDGRRPIEAKAEVRWTLPIDVAAPMNPGMGVRFGALSTVDKGIVDGLLSAWR